MTDPQEIPGAAGPPGPPLPPRPITPYPSRYPSYGGHFDDLDVDDETDDDWVERVINGKDLRGGIIPRSKKKRGGPRTFLSNFFEGDYKYFGGGWTSVYKPKERTKEEIEAEKLYDALRLLNSVVAIPFGDNIKVAWAEEKIGRVGLQRNDSITNAAGEVNTDTGYTLYLAPSQILAKDGSADPALVDALHGLALQEASHAEYTPDIWADMIAEAAEPLMKSHKKLAPMVGMIANWTEDAFVASKLTEIFKGFQTYIDNASAFFIEDQTIQDNLEIIKGLFARIRKDKLSSLSRQDMESIVKCSMELMQAVHRRGDEWADDIYQVLPWLEEIVDLLQDAATHEDVEVRLTSAIRGAEAFFEVLKKLLKDLDEESDGQGSLDAKTLADALEGAIYHTWGSADTPMAGSVGAGSARVAGPDDKALTEAQTNALQRHADKKEEEAKRQSHVRHTTEGDEQLFKARFMSNAELKERSRGHSSLVILGKEYEGTYSELAGQVLQAHLSTAQLLRSKLVLRDSEMVYQEYAQQSGMIDEDSLALVPAGYRKIYSRERVEAARGIDLAVLIDESGSMSTTDGMRGDQCSRWGMTMATALCLAYAIGELRSVRLRIFGYTTDWTGSDRETTIFEHYDSHRPSQRHLLDLGYVFPKSGNADGVAIRAIHKRLRKERDQAGRHPVFLMLSDGQPAAWNYSGIDHTAQAARAVIRDRIPFFHLQMSRQIDDSELQRMYGSRWERLTVPHQIPERVSRIVSTELARAGKITRYTT